MKNLVNVKNLINVAKYNFNHFMSDSVQVENLEIGATQNGGATKLSNGVYSNVESTKTIKNLHSGNQIAVYIPSTLDTDTVIDNSEYVEKYLYHLQANYPKTVVTVANTQGSWYSDNTESVVIEKITILTVDTEEITEKDIQIMQAIGTQVREEMSQDAVSITFNGSLALV